MKLLSFRKIVDKILDRKQNKLVISLWNNEDLSLPVLGKLENGKMVETLFVYTKPTSSNGSDVGLPTALVKINSSNGEMLSYNLCDEDDFSFNRYKPLKYDNFDSKNRAYNLKRFYEVYDKVRELAFNSNVSSQNTITLAEFKTLFYKVAYKEHIPYYHELGKEFFTWLNTNLE